LLGKQVIVQEETVPEPVAKEVEGSDSELEFEQQLEAERVMRLKKIEEQVS
jgi:hypothetical protein